MGHTSGRGRWGLNAARLDSIAFRLGMSAGHGWPAAGNHPIVYSKRRLAEGDGWLG